MTMKTQLGFPISLDFYRDKSEREMT